MPRSLLIIVLTLPLLMTCLSSQVLIKAEAKDKNGQCVVLLHGLRRTFRSMIPMADAFASAGYLTINMDYDSAAQPIEELAVFVLTDAISRCRINNCERIHFVTHSMGGILLRYYLSKHSLPRLGRVVMLSPPNQGSEVVDALRHVSFFKWYNGPAGQQLGTGPDGIATRLGPVNYPVGIITGNQPSFFDTWLSKYISEENDGKVSVKRAKVTGMRDFLVLPYSHTFIMKKEPVIFQTQYFLEHGSFKIK